MRPALDELTRASLITEQAPGRYALHDLLLAYAQELAGRRYTGAERDLTRRRLIDHYLCTALVANRLFDPLGPAMLAVLGCALDDGYNQHVESLAMAIRPFLKRSGRWDGWARTDCEGRQTEID